jgi:acetolactate synthase I/II/III large subunit
MRTGGQILVDALRAQGADLAFGVPGESYLAVLDALHDTPELQFTICRQEGGAAMMADAYGKMTGKPGLCFVTRGPGATNASPGVHIAQQDSTPMILFIGQVARDQVDREAFQEIDYRRMFGQLAKWVAQIDDAARIPEYVARAYHTATTGRPGPVVLALPEDMLRELADVKDVPASAPVEAHASSDDLTTMQDMLSNAERPFVILGGGGWDAEACANLETFAAAWNLPVGASFRAQDRMNNDHPNYVGDVGIGINPKLAARVREADVMLVLGARLGEMTTNNYTLIEAPNPTQKLIHVYPGAEELGRVFRPTLGINAGMKSFLSAAAGLNAKPGDFADRTKVARAEYEEWNGTLAPVPGDVHMGEVVHWIQKNLNADTVICNGAGNYSGWIHRFNRYRSYRTQLAPTSGSMGYGTPAAVAAKILHPERDVIAFAGDGCFMMNGQEFATAVQYGANICVFVVNNSMYGTIRMHQEREYPARVSGTELTNPDFAALAIAYGGHGEVVERTEDFEAAFQRAKASGKPSLIEFRIDPEAITPSSTLSAIRDSALKSGKGE